MAETGEGFVRRAVHNLAFKTGDRKIEMGTVSFVTTSTSATIPTELTHVEGAKFTPMTDTPLDPDGAVSTDGVVSAGDLTINRPASGTSGLTVYYEIIGRKDEVLSQP